MRYIRSLNASRGNPRRDGDELRITSMALVTRGAGAAELLCFVVQMGLLASMLIVNAT